MQGSILVVDDEEVLARHLARALQASGYQAVTALSAAEARRKVREADPDLVLMDLRLPDADGAELIGQLKSEHPETQFIVITAFGSIRSAIDATRLGAHDYLVKPFEPEELLISVRNAMAERRLTAEVRHLRARHGERHRRVRTPRRERSLARDGGGAVAGPALRAPDRHGAAAR